MACQADPLADLPGSSSSGTHHHFFPLPESDPLEVPGISRVSSARGHHSPSPSRLCPATAGGQQEQWGTPPGRCKSRQLSASSGGGGGEPAAAEQAGLAIKKNRQKNPKKPTSKCFLLNINIFKRKSKYFLLKVHAIHSGLISYSIFVKNNCINNLKLHIFETYYLGEQAIPNRSRPNKYLLGMETLCSLN